ncbi:MAG: hypothetical protein ABSC63_10730 [Candidatus Binataceae bacterium]
MASVDCGHRTFDLLILKGPALEVIINNQQSSNPVNRQLDSILDTGSEWNLIEDTLAVAVLYLPVIDWQVIRTATGSARRPVYMAQITIPQLTYSKLHRFIGVNLGSDLAIVGREMLADFRLVYSGRTGSVTLEY